jgi:hypothetical protein
VSTNGSQHQPDLQIVKAAAKRRFGHVPGVEGLGLSEKALRIYVEDQEVEKKLPPSFCGVPVEVIVTGPISVLSAF